MTRLCRTRCPATPAGGARTPNASTVFMWWNGSIIGAAPSSPLLFPRPPVRHAPGCCHCQTFYFGNSTWHRELVPVIPLRAQPQVSFMRAAVTAETPESEGLSGIITDSMLVHWLWNLSACYCHIWVQSASGWVDPSVFLSRSIEEIKYLNRWRQTALKQHSPR